MKNVMNESEAKMILNTKGIILLITVVLALTFVLGFVAGRKQDTKQVATFTREDLERIVEFQELEEDSGRGGNIYAYVDRKGNLMIGFDYED